MKEESEGQWTRGATREAVHTVCGVKATVCKIET